jgi:signal transduction histidine kinase
VVAVLAVGGLVTAVYAEASAFGQLHGPVPRLLLYAVLTVAPLLLLERGPLHVWRLQLLGLVALGLTPAPPAWPWSVTGLVCLVVTLVFTALAEDADLLVGVAVWTLVALVWSGRNTQVVAVAALALAIALLLFIIAVQRAKQQTQRELSTTRAALDAEVTDRAVLAERTRIARELHDSVGHRMTMIAIQAEAVRLRHRDLPVDAVSSLEAIQAAAREALAETRSVVSLLRSDSPPGQHGADSADGAERAPAPQIDQLDDLVVEARRGGMTLEYRRTGSVRPLPTATELAVFRIVQESLANAARHAAGAPVDIHLDYSDDAVTVSVVNARPAQERSEPEEPPAEGTAP